MNKLRFGILSTANIGIKFVIPALQQSRFCEVTAIASRSEDAALKAAGSLGIPRFYGSYEALLSDPDIDAVYIPLPNQLHVPWSIKALHAGKHVLCEKPVALNADEARTLLHTSQEHPGQVIMEAFMYRFHPRWERTRQIVADGAIGELQVIHSFFSYFNDDPGNIRNKSDMGGGGLMDIGCYSISSARYLFEREPVAVHGVIDMDPELGVDRLASGLLDFGGGTCVFSASMRVPRYQYLKVFGTGGYILMDQPFNPPPDESTRLIVTSGETTEELTFDPCNQFTLQADRFAKAVRDQSGAPTSLEDSVANMEVIDRMKKHP